MDSTPQETWDEWYKEERGGTGKPSWELTDTDTKEDELEIDDYGT